MTPKTNNNVKSSTESHLNLGVKNEVDADKDEKVQGGPIQTEHTKFVIFIRLIYI